MNCQHSLCKHFDIKNVCTCSLVQNLSILLYIVITKYFIKYSVQICWCWILNNESGKVPLLLLLNSEIYKHNLIVNFCLLDTKIYKAKSCLKYYFCKIIILISAKFVLFHKCNMIILITYYLKLVSYICYSY